MVSSTPWPGTPGNDTVPIVQEAGWAPEPVWTGGKSRPQRDFFLSFAFILQIYLPYYNRSGIDELEITEDINNMS